MRWGVVFKWNVSALKHLWRTVRTSGMEMLMLTWVMMTRSRFPADISFYFWPGRFRGWGVQVDVGGTSVMAPGWRLHLWWMRTQLLSSCGVVIGGSWRSQVITQTFVFLSTDRTVSMSVNTSLQSNTRHLIMVLMILWSTGQPPLPYTTAISRHCWCQTPSVFSWCVPPGRLDSDFI